MPKTLDENRLDPRELAAWRGFLITHSRVIGALDEELEREHGLPLGSYEVLLHLAGSDGHSLRMGQLADHLLLSRSGLTRLVDRLARRGLVERHSCPSDRRGTYARLTADGLRRFEEARPTHLRGVREHFIAHIPEHDLERLAAIWDRVLEPGS
ncbi:MAG: MarR family transcriptional regulator [Solirubrobacterales bacterium]|nr:MarR family transcriptional regulator [Solirubrobacterales bacterium]